LHAAAALSSGSVLVFGGFDGETECNDVWLLDSVKGAWLQLGTAPWSPRTGHAAVTLHDDSVLLFGGFDGRQV